MNILDLKNKHKGDEVVLLGAGPSLSDYSPKELEKFVEGKIVLAIKQAYLRYPKAAFHFINDNNLVNYEWDSRTTVLASHSTNVNVPFLRTIADYFFYIEQNTRFENSLSHDLDFDECTFEKRPFLRKLGPGILYELVLFFCYHIGVKTIYSLGVDLAPKGEKTRKHFYQNIVLNPAHSLGEAEANSEIELSGHFYRWLKGKGVEWYKLSERENYLHKDIPLYDSKKSRQTALDELVGQAQELNMGY